MYHIQPPLPPPTKKSTCKFQRFFWSMEVSFFQPCIQANLQQIYKILMSPRCAHGSTASAGGGNERWAEAICLFFFALWSHIMEVDHFPEWKGNWYSREPFSTSMIGEGRVKKSRCFQRSLLVAFRHPLGMSSSVIFQGFLRTYPTLENGTLSEKKYLGWRYVSSQEW